MRTLETVVLGDSAWPSELSVFANDKEDGAVDVDFMQLAADGADDDVKIGTLQDMVNNRKHEFPDSENMRKLKPKELKEAKDAKFFHDMFSDYVKKGRCPFHMQRLANAMAFMAVDDMLCKKVGEMSQEIGKAVGSPMGPVPPLDDDAIKSYINSALRCSQSVYMKGGGAKKGRWATKGYNGSGEKNLRRHLGASVSNGSAFLHVPLSAGDAIEKWLTPYRGAANSYKPYPPQTHRMAKKNEREEAADQAVPRLKAMIGGGESAMIIGMLTGGSSAFHETDPTTRMGSTIRGVVMSLLADMAFPSGKLRVKINLPINDKGKLIKLYYDALRAEKKKTRIDQETLKIVADKVGDLSMTLNFPSDGDAVVNEHGEFSGSKKLSEFTREDTPLYNFMGSNAPDDEAADELAYAVRREYASQVSRRFFAVFHMKMEIPKKLAQCLCQVDDAEDYSLKKLYDYGMTIMDLYHPRMAPTITDQDAKEVSPPQYMPDPMEMDASCRVTTTYKGEEISPIRPSNLVDENDLSVSMPKEGSSLLMWIPGASDSENMEASYQEYIDLMSSQNCVDIGNENIYSPGLNEFTNSTGLSKTRWSELSAEDQDRVLEFSNRSLGPTRYAKTRDKKGKINSFLRTSPYFNRVLYTTENGDTDKFDVEGNRPARKMSYQNFLERSSVMNLIKTENWNALAGLAGVSPMPADYVEKDDFRAIIGDNADDPSFDVKQDFLSGQGGNDWLSMHEMETPEDLLEAVRERVRMLISTLEDIKGGVNPENALRRRRIENHRWIAWVKKKEWNSMELDDAVGSISIIADSNFGQHDDEGNPFFIPIAEVNNWAGTANFLHRFVKSVVGGINGDYLKLTGHEHFTMPVLSEKIVPMLIIFDKYALELHKGGGLSREVAAGHAPYVDMDLARDGYKEPMPVPNISKGLEMMPHQLKAEDHLRHFPEWSVLHVQAGGGKSFMAIMDVLRFLESGKKKILMVCPGGLVPQYTEECAKFGAGRINAFPIEQTNVYKKYFDEEIGDMVKSIMNAPINTLFILDANIMSHSGSYTESMSYGGFTVQRNFLIEGIRQIPWDVIYIDESHRAKNPKSGYYMNYAKIVEVADHVRLMSGTFVHNTLTDVLGQVNLMYPDLLPSKHDFLIEHADNIVDAIKGKDPVWSDGAEKNVMEDLKQKLDLVQIRRAEWSHVLPQVHLMFYTVNLTPRQEKIYDLLFRLEQDKIDELLGADDDDKKDSSNTVGLEDAIGNVHHTRIALFLSSPESDMFLDPEEGIKIEKVVENMDIDDARKASLLKLVQEIRDTFDAYEEKDKVSPKTRAIYNPDEPEQTLLHRHFFSPEAKASENVGKVMIFTSYRQTAREIHKYLSQHMPKIDPNATESEIMHYKAEDKKALVEEMKQNKSVKVVVGVETSLNTGFNFQQFSRLIRIESPWTPGELEQGESRINRPDIPAYKEAMESGEEFSKDAYMDVICLDRTLDVTRSMRLIAKRVSMAKASNIDVDYYDDLRQLKPIKIMQSFGGGGRGRRINYSFKDGGADPKEENAGYEYQLELNKLQAAQALDFEEQRERIKRAHERRDGDGKLLPILYSVPAGGDLAGSASAETPYVEGGTVPCMEEFGLQTFSQKAEEVGARSQTLTLENIPGKRRVHCVYGDGILTSLSDTTATIRFPDGSKKTGMDGIMRNSFFFMPDGFKGTYRERCAENIGLPLVRTANKEISVTQANLDAAARDSDAFRENMDVLEGLAEDGQRGILLELAIEMGLLEPGKGKRIKGLMDLFHGNPRAVADYSFDDKVGDDGQEDDATLEDMPEDWLTDIDVILDEMREDLTKRELVSLLDRFAGRKSKHGRMSVDDLIDELRNHERELIEYYNEEYHEEDEPESRQVNMRLIQVNNLLAVAASKEDLEEDEAGKLGFEEMGDYVYFDVTSHGNPAMVMDKFLDKLEAGENKGHYYISEEYWHPLLHHQKMLAAKKDGGRLVIVDKAQEADVLNFLKAKRTRARKVRGVDTLELHPVVFRDTDQDDERSLFIMAYLEKQEQAVRNLVPGKFRVMGKTWKKETGFWFKAFASKNSALAGINRLARKMDGLGIDLNVDRMKETLEDIMVRTVKRDNSKLRSGDSNLPSGWTDPEEAPRSGRPRGGRGRGRR